MSVAAVHEHPQDVFAARMAKARSLSDELFDLVLPSAIYERPIAERHRIIFYLGHLEAFDWNLLCRGLGGMESFDAGLDRLFAFGIDPTNGDLPDDKPGDWPSKRDVLQYNGRIRAGVDRAIAEAHSPEAVLRSRVAIEHRLMHVETLSYMLHQLPYDQKQRRAVTVEPKGSGISAPGRRVEIPEGDATLGIDCSDECPFGWDNEFKSHRVRVPAFAIDVLSVTNGHYLEFLHAGGYERRELWSEEGWNWITTSGIAHPRFWRRKGDRWLYRTVFAEVPLPLAWPVYVSHAEAEAFARWRGRALPTEAQFHRAAFGTPEGIERQYPWGAFPPDSSRGNFDFASWTPSAVGSYPRGNSAFGVADLVGNGYEWTSTVFAPFVG